MAFKVLSVQETPNPNAKKLILDRQICESPLSFRSVESAAGHALAERLMAVPGVVGIFMLYDFVTISKSSEARWADISSKAKRIVAKADQEA